MAACVVQQYILCTQYSVVQYGGGCATPPRAFDVYSVGPNVRLAGEAAYRAPRSRQAVTGIEAPTISLIEIPLR